MTAPVAVITPVRGRLPHLRNQRRFLREVAPGVQHVVVAVDSPDVVAELAADTEPGLHVVTVDGDPLGMPTARARNAGAAVALELGAELLIFLDVDCAPLPGFVEALLAASHAEPPPGAVYNGIVTYLAEGARLDGMTPAQARSLVHPHAARPAPPSGEVVTNRDHHLLWSLAFAVTPAGWQTIGGFDEVYVGYGAEDTDFGARAHAEDLDMAWVGGAHALHQWHPSAIPPVHHLEDIVRNARLYRERWARWPMEGWLAAFAQDGLVTWTEDSLDLTAAGRQAAAHAQR